MQLENYASGQWIAGSGKQAELVDAITGELIDATPWSYSCTYWINQPPSCFP